MKITGFDTFDVRFPTSRQLDGSDAMNPNPDYSAAYLIVKTDAAPADEAPPGEVLAGYGYVFTIGRGNRDGFPAYTTTPGWLGYSDEQLAALCRAAVAAGFDQVKLKVGAKLEDDVRRIQIAREAVGDGVAIALDANQVWDVPTAVSWMRALARFEPDWIEEPTSPDDILGTAVIRREISPVRVAAGEHVASQPAARRQVRGAGVPACGRRRPLRACAAPGDAIRARGVDADVVAVGGRVLVSRWDGLVVLVTTWC